MTVTGPGNAPDVVDVVALGESMVTFLPSRPGRLADVPSFDRGIGGAESNVACVLAAAGHSARWVSRVGADGFGDHLTEAIGGYGVDVSAVRRDPERPTGVYFRTAGDRATDAHEVAYYRAGSAASAMAVENVDMEALRAARVLHLSGITAALSDDCFGLLWQLTAPRPDRPLVSFDVNFRPGLWRDADGPHVLLDLARRADIVFVGTDEARAAWNITGGPETIRELLPEPGVLVVKDGARGATAFSHAQPAGSRAAGAMRVPPLERSREWGRVGAAASRQCGQAHPPPAGHNAGQPENAAQPTQSTRGTPQAPGCATHPRPTATPSTFVPALTVTPVATVGAGDAFAAGFLSGTLRELPVRDRIRHGHLMAAATLTAPGDLAPPPARDTADRLAALDDDAWGTLRLGPGWTTQTEHRAEKEARTP